MKNIFKRIISLQGLILFLGFAVLSLLTYEQQVSAIEQPKLPYLIKVNRACNTVTVYEKDKLGEFTLPVKAMVCSVGAKGQTKVGTFQTKAKYRWKLLKGDVWGQYSTRIVGGILFHSVYYYENGNPATLATSEYNKLGTSASHGCVRLTVQDAKWIYDNCDVGTTVVVYDDAKNPGPLGKPKSVKLPLKVRWDPTDPNDKNPYYVSVPTITGAKDIVTEYGVKVDLLKGITAKTSVGVDLTPKISVEGTVNVKKAGIYKITYSVKDDLGQSVAKAITVTVKENPIPPELIGVSDKLVNGDIIIDKAFALQNVEVYRAKKKLDNSLIKVKIEKISEDDYKIVYKVTLDEKTATASALVHIDAEAPVITGMHDFDLETGEIPEYNEMMKGITVSDNYSQLENINVSVKVTDNPEGGCIITYQAVDEAGNIATEQALIIY